MSPALAPGWALGGLALHAQDDPHLVDGIHYRLFTDPRLGLPMRPVHLWRRNLGLDASEAEALFPAFPPLRHEATWTDAQGRLLAPPFDVRPDNPVTGRLPTHVLSRCIWLRLDGTEGAGGHLHVEILRTTARGLRPLAARDAEPYSLGASEIDAVRVSGEGTVHALTWLDVRRLAVTWDDFAEMGLPREQGARYLDPRPGGARADALRRVERGSPRRFGLHDAPDAASAAGAPPAAPVDEAAKLAALAPRVADALDQLLDDVSAPQHALRQQEVLTPSSPGATAPAEASWKAMELVSTALADPTMARWLGFLDVDLLTTSPPEPGDVVVYQLYGWWAIDADVLAPAERLSFLPAAHGLLRPQRPAGPGGPAWDASPESLPIFELWVPAVAVAGVTPSRPAPPVVDAEQPPSFPATPDGLGPWLPAPPPDARRQAVVPVRGLVPAAGLAVAAASVTDGAITGMNERVAVRGGSADERALLLVPAIPRRADEPGTGQVAHRAVPAEGLTVRVAQSDVFGRWSDWGERTLAAKRRPAPPEPVLDVWYERIDLPDDGDNGGDGPRWGALQARVQVPPAASRAPGSHLLDRLLLSGTVDGHAFSVEAPAPAEQEGELVVDIPPPSPDLLPVGAVVEAVTTARWVDTAGMTSPPSAPRITRCADPRRPPPVEAPPELAWTARPDATGRARVRLEWATTAAQGRYRVYAADEQRLVHQATAARDGGSTAFDVFLGELDQAVDRPARAAVLRAHHGLFDREWFYNLTDEPLLADGQATLSFQHEVSGSLGVLATYKVVAETGAGTPAAFAASPLWVWAVPERSGPLRPSLEVVTATAGPPATVTLRVRLTGRPADAARFRLRRSAVHADPRRMPVAREGDIVLGPDGRSFELVDDGRFVHDPAYRLQVGTRYSWTVEVRAPDLPGSPRPGAWSQASASVSTVLRPTGGEG